METDTSITKVFPQNRRKLESVESKIRDIVLFNVWGNKTIIPLTLVGYELINDSQLGALHLFRNLKAHTCIQCAFVE